MVPAWGQTLHLYGCLAPCNVRCVVLHFAVLHVVVLYFVVLDFALLHLVVRLAVFHVYGYVASDCVAGRVGSAPFRTRRVAFGYVASCCVAVCVVMCLLCCICVVVLHCVVMAHFRTRGALQ